MRTFFLKFIQYYLICFILVLFFSATASSDPPKETWAGKMTGMFEGAWTMNAWQTEETPNEMTIKGRVKMKMASISGGYGTGDCEGTLKGKIKEGMLQAKFFGTAYVVDGESDVYGDMTGTLSETKGSGTYNFSTRVGRYKGQWTIEKQ